MPTGNEAPPLQLNNPRKLTEIMSSRRRRRLKMNVRPPSALRESKSKNPGVHRAGAKPPRLVPRRRVQGRLGNFFLRSQCMAGIVFCKEFTNCLGFLVPLNHEGSLPLRATASPRLKQIHARAVFSVQTRRLKSIIPLEGLPMTMIR